MNVASRTILLTALLAPAAVSQEPLRCGYPERDILSPFRSPADVYAPPDELFRNLRIMQGIADKMPEKARYDDKGRQVVDHDAWRAAHDRVQQLGIDAGLLAQMMRLHRDGGQRRTAYFGSFYCDNLGYVMELISHIPGEPVRATREMALPRAAAFLRAHLGRRFGDLTDEERALVVANMPQVGSPAAKARGLTRAPDERDHLHSLRLVPFFQLLDCEAVIDRAQGLWFLRQVFDVRIDLAQAWLEPALPRVQQLLEDDDEAVKDAAIALIQSIGPADLAPPPEDAAALRAWADLAGKHLFPAIRNLNDTIIQLFPGAERDAVAAAGVQALEQSSIGDPFRGQDKDGKWFSGYRLARVPDALAPLAIPAEAVITSVNGVAVESAASLLAVARKLCSRARPTRLFVEYVRDGERHAVEYRLM